MELIIHTAIETKSINKNEETADKNAVFLFIAEFLLSFLYKEDIFLAFSLLSV